MDTNQIQWLAGLLEGEGSFALQLKETRRNGKTWSGWYLRVQLSMTDRDVVERAQRIMGVGRIYEKKPPVKHPTHKMQYALSVQKSEEAYAVMVAIFPFMGERRQADIKEAVTSWLSIQPKRFKDRCPKGHPFTAENTAIDTKGYRRCRECSRERERRRSRQ